MPTHSAVPTQLTSTHDRPVLDDETATPNSVLGKAFAILSAFEHGNDTLRLIDLSRRSGIPKPSVYRLVQQLVDLGLLERAASGYRLGYSMFALGQRVHTASRLGELARPILIDLYAATGAAAQLYVLDAGTAFCVEQVGGMRSASALSKTNRRSALTSSAAGRVLLAMSGDGASTLCDDESSRAAPRTPFDAGLGRDLLLIRSRRFDSDDGRVSTGFKTIAVPVPSPSTATVSALCASVPVAYRSDRTLLTHLWSAAGAIGRRYDQEAMMNIAIAG